MLRNIVLLLTVVNISAREQTLEIPHVDHVIRSLTSQQWDEDEASCRSKIFHLLDNVKNSTLWAEWVWNSIPQSPTGLFYGTRYHVGNHNQCLHPPWLSTNPELRTQYCVAEVELDRSRGVKTNHLPGPYERSEEYYLKSTGDIDRSFSYMAYGVCLPAGCPTKSVEKFVKALLITGHLQATKEAEVSIYHCEEAGAPRVYPRGFYIYFFIFAALFVLAVVSTYYVSEFPAAVSQNSFANHVAKSFCLRRNWGAVFKSNTGALACLQGIKFLTAAEVILIHQLSYNRVLSVSNVIDYAQPRPKVTTNAFFAHFDLMVENFFAISALLLGMSLSTMDVTTPYNLLRTILKRYIRVVVALTVAVMYMTHVSLYVDSNPIFPKLIKSEQQACEQNWWLTLLLVGNYFNTDNTCYTVSWYIPCDFQLYVITLILLYVYRKNPSAGKVATAITLVLGFVAPAVTTYVHDLPALLLLGLEANSLRQSKVYRLRYITTHNHISAYAVGLLVGYLMSVYKPADYKKVISKKKSCLGTMVSFALMIGMLFLGGLCYKYRVYGTLACIFETFNKTTFALGILGIIVFCTYGDVPLLNSLLSWSGFGPLSRLSYGVYILHMPLFYRSKFSLRNYPRFHKFDNLTEYFGLMMLSLMLSMAVWLLIEAPLINFTNPYLSTRSKLQKKTNEAKNDEKQALIGNESEKQKSI